MFRIRRIHDAAPPISRSAISEVQRLLREQFPLAPQDDADNLAERLHNPFLKRFRTVLYVAVDGSDRVLGFAILLHEPDAQFAFLDYIATIEEMRGRGIGSAIYDQVREEVRASGALGLFFECLPDEPHKCRDAAVLKQNAARLKFYERYGARPIVNTAYETPVPLGGSDCLPYLVYDDLDLRRTPGATYLQAVIRAVLERKYQFLCPPDYVDTVVNSVKDDPAQLREYRYRPKDVRAAPLRDIVLVVNRGHSMHHIRERGYVEAPVRVKAILRAIQTLDCFQTVSAKECDSSYITAVHDPEYVNYLEAACKSVPVNSSVYPYVFPIRNPARPPRDLAMRAGYYCIDTFTPINSLVLPAAKGAVDCSVTAAEAVLHGAPLAYALVRPPGHHAEGRVFGGFCYFNNAAIAAQIFSRHGKVAILDIDYHHGNGQQEIFYDRSDVLTISIHGDPEFAYPYFTGFADEQGTGAGTGYNVNLPQEEVIDGARYRIALDLALDKIRAFGPQFLVIALGLDTAKGDPTGTWTLAPHDFQLNGERIRDLQLPTLVIQEGGYRVRTMGTNARHFFYGLARD